MQKKTVPAKQVVEDFRAGATDEFLMQKYGLSEKSLQSVYQKLLAANMITQAELDSRTSVAAELKSPEVDAGHAPLQKSSESNSSEDDQVRESTTKKTDSLILYSLLAGLITGWAFARMFTKGWLWFIIWLPVLSLVAGLGYYLFLERFKNKVRYIVVASTVFAIVLMGIYLPKGKTSQAVSADAGKQTGGQVSQRTPGVGNPKAIGDCQEPEIPFPVQQVRKDAPGSEALSALLRSEVILSPSEWYTKDPILKTIFQGKVPLPQDLIRYILETEYNLPPEQKHPKDPRKKVWLSSFVRDWHQIVQRMTSEKLAAASPKETDQSRNENRWKSPHEKKLQDDNSSEYLIKKLFNNLHNEGLENWVMPFQSVADLVRSSIDRGIEERKAYFQALKERESRIAQCRKADEERLKKERERYVQEIKAGKRPVASIDDVQIKLAAVDGDDYIQTPPTSTPNDSRYLFFRGAVETQQGDIIICHAGHVQKWAFRATGIKSYIPRVNEMVKVIGKISGVVSGRTVIGKPIYMVVVDAVAVEDGDGKFHQR